MVQGIVTGIVAGVGIFIVTNWLVLKGGDVVGPHLGLLDNFFIGYQVSFFGSLIGFVYGFLTGFITGYVVARIYNWVVGLRQAKPPTTA
jgi:hypothetical protein